MIFDINTAIGHWPFRHVPHTTLPELRALLSAKGIAGAAVAHTHALFYKDCHRANLELAEALQALPDFFTGVATINPRYAAWERDLTTCVNDLGMRAVRAAPLYHDYTLDSPEAHALLAAATNLGVTVFLPARIVDPRQRHWRDAPRQFSLAEAGVFAQSVAGARVLTTDCALGIDDVITPTGEIRYPQLFIEMSRLRSAFGQDLARIAKAIGAKRLVFGSGAPFKEITPALLRLQMADLDPAAKTQIAGAGAKALLTLAK